MYFETTMHETVTVASAAEAAERIHSDNVHDFDALTWTAPTGRRLAAVALTKAQTQGERNVKAFINIPKRRGSSVTTRNGAVLTAVKASTVRGLCDSWSLEGDGSEVDAMQAARDLRERLQMSLDELRDKPHSSFADLEAAGVFGGLVVLERRGFWRVEYDR